MTRSLKFTENINIYSWFKLLTVFIALSILGLAGNVFSFENISFDLSFPYGLQNINPVYEYVSQQTQTDMTAGLNKTGTMNNDFTGQRIPVEIDKFLYQTGLTGHNDLKKRLLNKSAELIAGNQDKNTSYSPFMMMKINAFRETFMQKPLEQLVANCFPNNPGDESHNEIMTVMQKEIIDYIDSIKVSHLHDHLMFYLMNSRLFEYSA